MEFKLTNYLFNPCELYTIHRRMKREKKLSAIEIREMTFKHIKEVCCYANEHVPYYKKLFKEYQICPETFISFEDFEKIPILTKDDVRNHYNELISDEKEKIPRVVKNETSGSTGTPLEFLCDGIQNMAVFNLFWDVWQIGGAWRIGKKQAMLGGYTGEGIYSFNPINRILYMSAFDLSRENVKVYYDALIKYKPAMLRGYPSAIFFLGHLLEEVQLKLHFDVIFCYAETLLSFQREYIEKAFDAKVIDQYSQQESIGCICECECGNKHAYTNFGYYEVVDDAGNAVDIGTEGRLICTGFFNRVMPLIRYDTRDLVTFSRTQQCTCGCSFPVVDNIFGRVEDTIVTPEGRFVGRLDAAFKYSANIELASIFQETREEIDVLLAMSGKKKLSDDDPLESELRKRLGSQIRINYKYVSASDIPRTKAGKVKFVVSKIPRSEKFGHI